MKNNKPILIEDLGLKYPTDNATQRHRFGLYECPFCGQEFIAKVHSIKSGGTKSCGCFTKSRTHGLRNHILYHTWNNIVNRCNNTKIKHYINYGARGIQVCERWLDIRNFVEDMYPSWEEGLTLDRIDVNGNYEPDNCRWVDLNTQARNTRDIQINNKSGYRGVSYCTRDKVWRSYIKDSNKTKALGSFNTALEAGKAYERYVRLNNLEHNFTPALTEDEIKEIENLKNLMNN